jgi:hypothetical protein
MNTVIANRKDAFDFLVDLHGTLRETLPSSKAMATYMTDLENNPSNPHKIRENRFLYEVLNTVKFKIEMIAGISPDEARESILCEYHGKHPELSSNNAFRKLGHPFSKKFDASVDEVFVNGQGPLQGIR